MGELLPLSVLRALWPHGDQHVPELIEGIAASAPSVFASNGITSTLEVAHTMAQFSEECGAGLEMVENLNYSASGLTRTFPTHFTGTMADHYQHNPRMIADVAYGGRMGNARPPSDDGWNYRGKGLSQLTGKDNYRRLATITGLDVVSNPDLLIQPATALECAVADFVRLCGCLPYARRDDVHGVTLHLNGGFNGLAEREQWLARWKAALRPFTTIISPSVKPDAPPPPPDALKSALRGSDGQVIAEQSLAPQAETLAPQAETRTWTGPLGVATTKTAVQRAEPWPLMDKLRGEIEDALRGRA
jgi:putative chitinase